VATHSSKKAGIILARDMHKMISNKTLRCIVILAIAALGSASSLRSNNNNANHVEQSSSTHQFSSRLLQNDVQQPTDSSGGSESGSTLVIVGAVGAVISILILIGGVCYAKRSYSSDNNNNNGPGRRQYLNDTMEEKEMSNIISSMEKNAAKKEKGGSGGGGGGGYFKRSSGSGSKGGSGTAVANNGRADAAAAAASGESVGYESDVPPPPPENFMNDEQTSDDESDMHYNGIGAGNRSRANTGDDDMSFAYSVDQSSIAPYNRQQQNNSIDPYIGGAAALQSFQNEKGGVFEWNEDGTKMVYTPAMGDDEKKAQNGFVYDERKKKWVVSKQVVGAKGVSFKPTTSANDGKSSAMMMTESPKELQRTHSDASTRSYGSGTTGNSGLTGMGSEFTFGAVGTDYSTVRTRSGTTFVSTGIAIPSPSNAGGGQEVEVEGVSAIDRLMLMDDDDLSNGSSDEGHSNLGHVAGDMGQIDDEPGMIIPKKTVSRLKSNTIKEDTPFDEVAKPRPKPVPNFDSSPRHFVRKNRKPSFGRRV